jgi:secondary thiamine-phosphate synthase enzyme
MTDKQKQLTKATCKTDIYIHTHRHREVLDVTPDVSDVVEKSGITAGICHVFVAHPTAAIALMEKAGPYIGADMLNALGRLIPGGIWQHETVDDNGAAHVQATLIGPSALIPVQNGQLFLGAGQAIMLVELDGPKIRELVVTISGRSYFRVVRNHSER